LTTIFSYPERPPQGIWNNSVSSLEAVRPELLAYPATTKTVIQLVRAAEASQQRVRMTGSGHSFSDVALNDDMLLLPNRLNAPLDLDRARLKPGPAADRHLVRVQGGMTVRDLNALLDSKCLALENMGGWDEQTITGVAMTATHGSGRRFGPLVAQIASLQMVTTGGELRQIEPTNGITNPATFPGFLEEAPDVPVTLVQDDDELNAVGVSMGSMGIVTAVVVRAVDKFWIRENRKVMRWSELGNPGGYLDRMIHHPPAPGAPDHVEVYINPYETKAGDHQCILTERYRLAAEPAPTLESRSRGALGDGALFNDGRLRSLAEDALRIELDRASIVTMEGILTDFLLAMKDPNYTAESYKVFNLGAINRLRAYGIELAFPIEKTLDVVKTVFAQAKREYALGRHHSVPFSLRFVKASDCYLAMQHGRETMMLEMGALVPARESLKLLQDYEQLFMQPPFSARPHWGLDMSVLKSWSQVEALYGEAARAAHDAVPAETAAAAWLRVYKRLNANGTFDGRFTDRLGISMRPKA
ncbi:MAG TPA: FAD-binding protein, partial [Polyangiaceae bacterium]|nr:FAD-binding protein [Polyangiaceae bacterium]